MIKLLKKLFGIDRKVAKEPTEVIIFVKNGYVESVVSFAKLDVKVIDGDYTPTENDNKVIDNLYKNPKYNYYPQVNKGE